VTRLLPVLLLLAVGFAPAPAQAQGLTLGQPSYGGTGCPQGTASAVLGPDGRTLSILYDQYVAETTPGRRFDRKSCNLAVPLHVPSGLSVSILGVDYRGFNLLPAGTSSTFRVEYFFAGSRGPIFERNFGGPLQHDFLIHNEIGVAAQVWSPCGQDVILRTNSSLLVSAPAGQRTYVAVDTEDIDAALVFLLQWRSC
jgi:hypothetical protein